MIGELKFWSMVKKSDGCWLWVGPMGGFKRLYGVFWPGRGVNRTCFAHRYSYELHKGQIPYGLQVDHLCRIQRCVNPAHLEAVTQSVNIRRAHAARLSGATLTVPS